MEKRHKLNNIEDLSFPTLYPRCLNLREVYIAVDGQCMPCCDLSIGLGMPWKLFFKEEWNLNYNSMDKILKSIETFSRKIKDTKNSPIKKCSKTCNTPWLNSRNYFHLELSTRCTLQCPKCPRTAWPLTSPTTVFEKTDMKFNHIEAIIKALPSKWRLFLQGSLGDAVFHPQLFDIIRLADRKKILFEMTTASPSRSLKWWEEFYKCYSNPASEIRFSVDGLEDTASIYRKGQDFNKVWASMKLGVKNGKKITWSFIPFSHNEHQIETASKMAKDNGIKFLLSPSNRWDGPEDPFKPKNPQLSANYDRSY